MKEKVSHDVVPTSRLFHKKTEENCYRKGISVVVGRQRFIVVFTERVPSRCHGSPVWSFKSIWWMVGWEFCADLSNQNANRGQYDYSMKVSRISVCTEFKLCYIQSFQHVPYWLGPHIALNNVFLKIIIIIVHHVNFIIAIAIITMSLYHVCTRIVQ